MSGFFELATIAGKNRDCRNRPLPALDIKPRVQKTKEKTKGTQTETK
jgi:hypothetical protein